jgi:hypothetical protein
MGLRRSIRPEVEGREIGREKMERQEGLDALM